jgi:hypothetical protein
MEVEMEHEEEPVMDGEREGWWCGHHNHTTKKGSMGIRNKGGGQR